VDDYSIIIRPLVTEQGMHFANTKGAYSFEVNSKANKAQIRNAVERVYNVKVDKAGRRPLCISSRSFILICFRGLKRATG